jgi:protein-tyrosine phosphatase
MSNSASVSLRPLDATRIVSRVYQGSQPPTGYAVSSEGFDVLVLCAQELEPQQPASAFPSVSVIRAGIDDGELTRAEWARAVRAAAATVGRIRSGSRALITCHMGLNRSGLVTALTLHMLTGRPGDEIVRHIQRRRSGALCNESFVKAIREQLR